MAEAAFFILKSIIMLVIIIKTRIPQTQTNLELLAMVESSLSLSCLIFFTEFLACVSAVASPVIAKGIFSLMLWVFKLWRLSSSFCMYEFISSTRVRMYTAWVKLKFAWFSDKRETDSVSLSIEFSAFNNSSFSVSRWLAMLDVLAFSTVWRMLAMMKEKDFTCVRSSSISA